MLSLSHTAGFAMLNQTHRQSVIRRTVSTPPKSQSNLAAIAGLAVIGVTLTIAATIGWSYASEVFSTISSSNPLDAARLISGMP